ncbi:MAG: cyanophycinase [Planctomycetota bacterium]
MCLLVSAAAMPAEAQRGSRPDFNYYLTGSSVDVSTASVGGLLLAGGGTDIDPAMRWFKDNAAGGDVVVIRASGSDGYNDYLFSELGGPAVNSVETIRFNRRAASSDPFVLERLRNAEAIFIAGGDQNDYVRFWAGTEVETILREKVAAGNVTIGGTSAGAVMLGSPIFNAGNGTLVSDDALADPFDDKVTLTEDLVGAEVLDGVLVDSHFRDRDREGRMMTFLARIQADASLNPTGAAEVMGVGIDDETALIIGTDGVAEVVARSDAGRVSVFETTRPAETLAPGEALTLRDVGVWSMAHGDRLDLVDFDPLLGGAGFTFDAVDGVLSSRAGLPEGSTFIIPEPASAVVLGAGLWGTVRRRRRRR